MMLSTRQTLRTAGAILAGLLILFFAMSLQFRLSAGEVAPYSTDANLPRWLLAFCGGALIALAGAHLPYRFTSPFLWLVVSTAALGGCVAGFVIFGDSGAVFGLVIAAALAFLLTHWLPHEGFAVIIAGLALAGAGIFLASQVKVEPGAGRALTWLAAGDVGHATLLIALIAAAALLILVLTRLASRSPLITLGLGVGLVGPVAFVAWWIPLAETRLTRLEGLQRDLMVAFAGGVMLLTFDSAQRFFIGGYGFGLNFPLALVGTPVWLWWYASQRSGWRGHAGKVLAAVIAIFACLFAAFAINTIQSAT
ncbi:MAG: hypothetical protein FJ194_14885 [Gammaproteobacteria bacterium]|nr:hypothetical protein [Gammaproteobacteria bacterium]